MEFRIFVFFYLTPLHIAAKSGQRRIVQLLLQSGANCDAQTQMGETPLHLAAMNGHDDIINDLISAGADGSIPDATGELPVNYAEYRGNSSAVALLKPHSVKKNTTPKSLFEAIDQHDLTQLALLLDAGFSPNTQINDTYPLHYALRKRRTECVPLLLQAGADMTLRSKGSQPLHIAACKGLDNAIRYLLKRGANINDINPKSGFTPLHYAIMNDHPSSVSLLISNGADPMLTARGNRTPLEVALAPTHNHDMFSAMMTGGLLKRINCENLLQVALQARKTSLAYMLTISNQRSWDPLKQLSIFATSNQLQLTTRRETECGLQLLKDTITTDHPVQSWAILDSL